MRINFNPFSKVDSSDASGKPKKVAKNKKGDPVHQGYTAFSTDGTSKSSWNRFQSAFKTSDESKASHVTSESSTKMKATSQSSGNIKPSWHQKLLNTFSQLTSSNPAEKSDQQEVLNQQSRASLHFIEPKKTEEPVAPVKLDEDRPLYVFHQKYEKVKHALDEAVNGGKDKREELSQQIKDDFCDFFNKYHDSIIIGRGKKELLAFKNKFEGEKSRGETTPLTHKEMIDLVKLLPYAEEDIERSLGI